MITHIDITGVGKFSLDDSTKEYIRKTIGKLDRFAPRHARKSMRAEVKVSEHGQGTGTRYQVEVVLELPEKKVTAKSTESTEMAATDVTEQKLAVQLKKYKSDRLPHVHDRKLLSRFKRSFSREQQ